MTEPQGKFQSYYERIKNEVEKIVAKNNYMNNSKGFAHWYLNNFEKILEEDLGEIIIDGSGDNGIDAMVIRDGALYMYQFKFPESIKNLNKSQDETTALKLINGYSKLLSSRKPKKANDNFVAFRERVSTENVYDYFFIFVTYTNGLSENAVDALETKIDEIKNKTGNTLNYKSEDKKSICNKYDHMQRKHRINLNLTYGQLNQSYNKEEIVTSWSGFAKASDILLSCNEYMDVIFDENIRNYEGDNSVNQGIIDTASNAEEASNFYFYHNGIVFICDECKVSTGNQVVSMEATAIVNGCQSVVSLNIAKNANKLQENVFLPIRIIKTSDMDLRAQITEYLNSQTKIKDSYFLANNAFIKELQSELLQKGYYLERLQNEYTYKRSLNKVNEYSSDRIMSLEKVVQVFIASANNQYASTAKRGKNELFDKNIIDALLQGINANKVIESMRVYNDICGIVTLFRKCRRAERNDEFLNYINLSVSGKDEYDKKMSEYLFMNTADFILLNTYYNLSDYNSDFNGKIREAIEICRTVINENMKLSPSGATKNATIFEQTQKKALVSTNSELIFTK